MADEVRADKSQRREPLRARRSAPEPPSPPTPPSAMPWGESSAPGSLGTSRDPGKPGLFDVRGRQHAQDEKRRAKGKPTWSEFGTGQKVAGIGCLSVVGFVLVLVMVGLVAGVDDESADETSASGPDLTADHAEDVAAAQSQCAPASPSLVGLIQPALSDEATGGTLVNGQSLSLASIGTLVSADIHDGEGERQTATKVWLVDEGQVFNVFSSGNRWTPAFPEVPAASLLGFSVEVDAVRACVDAVR